MDNKELLEKQVKEINDSFDKLDEMVKIYTEELEKRDINDIEGV